MYLRMYMKPFFFFTPLDDKHDLSVSPCAHGAKPTKILRIYTPGFSQIDLFYPDVANGKDLLPSSGR